MERVTLALDPNQVREPRVESAGVTVMLRDGREQQSSIKQSLGFPARPMERDDVQAKLEGGSNRSSAPGVGFCANCS